MSVARNHLTTGGAPLTIGRNAVSSSGCQPREGENRGRKVTDRVTVAGRGPSRNVWRVSGKDPTAKWTCVILGGTTNWVAGSSVASPRKSRHGGVASAPPQPPQNPQDRTALFSGESTDFYTASPRRCPRLEEMLPDRWAAAHPEAILTHGLEESRAKAARTRQRPARRRARPKWPLPSLLPPWDHGEIGRSSRAGLRKKPPFHDPRVRGAALVAFRQGRH